MISQTVACEMFESLVREHQDRFYRYAFRLTGNRDDAEDLLQQALLEAFAAFDRFNIGSHFDRWVFRIMHHTYLDTVRRRPRFSIESIETGWETGSGLPVEREIEDPHGGPEAELMETTLSEPLQQALDALPPDFRSVVILADMQDLTYEEVAQVLGCPIGTVRSRLHRARHMLRRSLLGEPSRTRGSVRPSALLLQFSAPR